MKNIICIALSILAISTYSPAEFSSASTNFHPNSEESKPIVHIAKTGISDELSLLTVHHLDVGLEPVKLNNFLADKYRFALKQFFRTGNNNDGQGSFVTIYLFFHGLDDFQLEVGDFHADGYIILGKDFNDRNTEAGELR